MSTFFQHFPRISYDINKNGKGIQSTNILKRFKPVEKIINKSVLYYTYDIKDGERPDMVSYKFYGTSDYDWLILIFNKKINPYFDWPLSYEAFENWMVHMYGSIRTSQQTIHHYERIIRNQQVQYDGNVIDEKVIIVDSTAYALLSADERRIIYAYDYYKDLNDDNRTVKILDETYIPQINMEMRSIFNGN